MIKLGCAPNWFHYFSLSNVCAYIFFLILNIYSKMEHKMLHNTPSWFHYSSLSNVCSIHFQSYIQSIPFFLSQPNKDMSTNKPTTSITTHSAYVHRQRPHPHHLLPGLYHFHQILIFFTKFLSFIFFVEI